MALDLDGNLVDQPNYVYEDTLKHKEGTVLVYFSERDVVRLVYRDQLEREVDREIMSMNEYINFKNSLKIKEKVTNF